MSKHKPLSILQREKELINLIEDSKIMNFDKKLIKSYEAQLKQIQQEIKKDKEKEIKLNNHIELKGGILKNE